MARTRIKVCCIASVEEAHRAIAAGADALGLVAAMPSGPGVISDRAIAGIASAVSPPVASFLLSSRERGADLADHVAACGTSTVQVVRHVEPSAHEELAARCPAVRRVQVLHVEDDSVLELVDAYAPHVHAFLLDSGRPGAGELGGTGRVHDWTVSAELVRRSPRPVFLAGGLNAANVGAAIRQVRPFGLDICSGVRAGGQLDPAALAAFVEAARVADLG